MVEILLDESFHWVAPSRFGYLGSTFEAGAGHEEQAHAYAWLLDRLGIDSVAVVALSAGGHSAALFAALHPERVSSLTLLSAGVTAVTSEEQSQADDKGRTWVRIFQNDFLFWSVTKLFRKQVMGLIGVDETVIAALSSEQRELAKRFVDYMHPVSLRTAGATFDNTAVPAGARIAGVSVPTLVVHAEDDRLQLFEQAAFAAATIRGSTLLSFERGGHIVGVTEDATVSEAVQQQIRVHAR